MYGLSSSQPCLSSHLHLSSPLSLHSSRFSTHFSVLFSLILLSCLSLFFSLNDNALFGEMFTSCRKKLSMCCLCRRRTTWNEDGDMRVLVLVMCLGCHRCVAGCVSVTS